MTQRQTKPMYSASLPSTSPSGLRPDMIVGWPPSMNVEQVLSPPTPFMHDVVLARPHFVGGLAQPSQPSRQP